MKVSLSNRSEKDYGDLIRTAKENSRGKGEIGECNGRGNTTQETVGKIPKKLIILNGRLKIINKPCTSYWTLHHRCFRWIKLSVYNSIKL